MDLRTAGFKTILQSDPASLWLTTPSVDALAAEENKWHYHSSHGSKDTIKISLAEAAQPTDPQVQQPDDVMRGSASQYVTFELRSWPE